jgi:hypothetical protein
VLFVFSVQPALTTLLFCAEFACANGFSCLRAANGDTSRTVKLLNCLRPCFLSAEILAGSTQR